VSGYAEEENLTGDVTLERFRGVWRRLKAIEDTKPETMAAELRGVRDDVKDLASEVKGLRRVLVSLAVSLACSAVVFGLSVLAATGRI